MIVNSIGEWPFPKATLSRQAYPHPGGDWFEISEAHGNDLLNVLPPIYFPGGFFVSEPADHDASGRPVYAAVVRVNGRWFLRECAQGSEQECIKALHRQLAPRCIGLT